MKTFNEFINEAEIQPNTNLAGGLPSNVPNRSKMAQAMPPTPNGFRGHLDIGQVHVQLVNHTLHFDGARHRFNLDLTTQQVAELTNEFARYNQQATNFVQQYKNINGIS